MTPGPNPSRILITGATGFVGRWLLPALQTAYPAAALLTPAFDITDELACDAALEAACPDAIVHLAAIAAPSDARRDPARAWAVNLHGALALARATLRHAPQATFLFAGSADCYGATFRRGTALDEDAPLAPQSAYAATKAAADLALGAMVPDGLRLVRARPFNHTGPGQSDAFVVPAFAHQVARIEAHLAQGLQPPELHVGALDPERDLLDVRDVARAYALMLGADLAPGTVLNLASGQPRRVGDILDALLARAGVLATIRTDQTRLRPGDIPRTAGDATRARTLLGWAPVIPWEHTVADVLDDWRHRVTVA